MLSQINGNAYGPGIYISPHLGTSINYCQHIGSFMGIVPAAKKAKITQVNCLFLIIHYLSIFFHQNLHGDKHYMNIFV